MTDDFISFVLLILIVNAFGIWKTAYELMATKVAIEDAAKLKGESSDAAH